MFPMVAAAVVCCFHGLGSGQRVSRDAHSRAEVWPPTSPSPPGGSGSGWVPEAKGLLYTTAPRPDLEWERLKKKQTVFIPRNILLRSTPVCSRYKDAKKIPVGIIYQGHTVVLYRRYNTKAGSVFIPAGIIYQCPLIFIPAGIIYPCPSIFIPAGIIYQCPSIFIPAGIIYQCPLIFIPAGIIYHCTPVCYTTENCCQARCLSAGPIAVLQLSRLHGWV
ncbi:MAG: hypothetical protein J3K34DRAFT_389693 [Monoraphidium minutum]|nr:MAG: hypothetical protein J3K34DRAFT_389693 [Monoraphidium minutum]